ncbi:MAG: GDSL-type esterase/lipase family protein, partial [bacterium]
FNGRNAWIVKPIKPLEGKPWVWRAHFPEWHTDVDSILLTRGFHIAYVNTNDMYGSPRAMQVWNAFHAFMVKDGFAEKVVLEGVSRGGLYVYNWAKRNPLKVACIYAEAPVCDFKSWPGGKGVGKGSPSDWQVLLKQYGFTEEQALAYKDNPIDNLEGLAAAGVPVLHSIGLNDKIVPNIENTFTLINNYIKAGGTATVMPMTKGPQNLEGHHFMIEQPSAIADFISSNAYPVKPILDPAQFYVARTGLTNSFIQFTKEKTGRVAFMGGSITENPGWRNKVTQYLTERFPETKFEFIDAGISSTGSTPGAFRFASEVLSKGRIDLFFEEAAVNDRTNGFNNTAQVRGMEGIVRHARISNPLMDIVIMHCVDPEKIADYTAGKIPNEIINHELVASQYNANTVNWSKEVTARIAAGEFSWKEDFRDLHPSKFGQEVYARSLIGFLNKSYENIAADAVAIHHVLPKPIDPFSYSEGQYVDVKQARIISNWGIDEKWVPKDGAGGRKQFMNRPALIATEVGAELELDFSGKAIGICIASGPDAGVIEYSIDGKPFKKKDLYTQWSGFLHLPWYIVLEDELKDKQHRIRIRMSADKNEKSKGNACRIVYFLVNG